MRIFCISDDLKFPAKSFLQAFISFKLFHPKKYPPDKIYAKQKPSQTRIEKNFFSLAELRIQRQNECQCDDY